MSAAENDNDTEHEHDREATREAIRDLLDFHPDERFPCPQILGIGLVEDVCESDEGLQRWLVCQATEFVVDEGMAPRAALAEAFDLADEQCDHFDLERPADRQTDFGALEAQVERQQTLGASTRPERRGSQRGGPAPERDPEQATIGERPAWLSEFGEGGGNGNGNDNGNDNGNGADVSAPGDTRRVQIFAQRGPQGTVTFRPDAGEVSMGVAGEIEDEILELLGSPGRFDVGDRAGYAIVTDEDVSTRRELVAVGRTLRETVSNAESGGGQGNG